MTTPDIASGYDLELRNLTAADVVPGKFGQAFQFANTRQTMLARVHSPGEPLPINQHPALTISFWAKVKGTGLTDLRMFSEANTANNNPLFNIGTASDSASDKVDFFFRQDPWTVIDHVKTDGNPLDGTWRHLAFVQQEDGSRSFYVDGVQDLVGGLLTPKPVGEYQQLEFELDQHRRNPARQPQSLAHGDD